MMTTRPPSQTRLRLAWKFALALVAAGSLWNCSGTQLLNNLSTLSPGPSYSVERDIPYDEPTGLELDVYAPKKAEGAPVVVFFFPGRWSMGDKADYRFVAEGLVSRGMVAVLPNYRLYPEVRFPAFVEDAARAVRWTHEHVGKFGGDPDRLFVMGHSSGAHLAALLALDDEFLAHAGGNRGWLKGMIGLSGPYDFKPESAKDLAEMFGPPEKFELSQPIHYVDGSNPPLLLLHGRDDNAVDVQNTISLTAAVERAGGTVETVLYPELGHGLMVASLASYYRMPAGPLDKVDAFVHARMDVVRTARAASPGAP